MTIALIVILVILVLYVIITYNKFVTLKKQMNNSYSVIDVYLKKRFDLIPNLVEVTKGYANYEQDVLTKITEYRTAYSLVRYIASRPFAKTVGSNIDTDSKENFFQNVLERIKEFFYS